MAVSRQALDQALALIELPLLARVMRRRPLPQGVLLLIKIAAGCPETARHVGELTSAEPARVRKAAVLYLQTVVLDVGADNYRLLGLPRDAALPQLREHMHWLMKWLHPDRAPDEWESASAHRVLAAWQELKSPERRARYDSTLPPERSAAAPSRGAPPRDRRATPRIPWIAVPRTRKRRPWRRAALVAGAALGTAVAVLLLLQPFGTLGASAWSMVSGR